MSPIPALGSTCFSAIVCSLTLDLSQVYCISMKKSLTPTKELMQKISGAHWLDNKYVSGIGSRTAVIDPTTKMATR